MYVCIQVISCNLKKSWDTIYLELQNRLCIDSVFQGLTLGSLLITHWQETDTMSYRSFHFLEQAGHSPWVFPCDPLLWAAAPEHFEARVHLKLEWEWTQGLQTESTGNEGGRMSTNLADYIHLPVTNPSLAEVISDIKQSVSSI